MIVQDATLAQVAAVTARRLDFELPDVVIEQVPTRRYPETLAAHLFGYVGEANDTQVAGDDSLRSGDIVGQSGIEKVYNALLMGDDGARRVVVNSVGREIRTLEEEPATEGKRLALTVDYDLQKSLEDGFKWSGFNGASVIMDPHTGEVLAFTSVPAYDPNAFAAGPVDRATWASLNSDELRPLQDRAIQGRYSPGSTFKMAVATAALEEGVITPDFKVYCPGHATFFGRSFQCSLTDGRGHGTLDLRQAIEHSCNVYFYTVGNMVGIDKIHKWATLLGLGEKTGIDLPNEVQGLVPSPEWKRERFKEKWYAGETISVSIGQGAVALTPVSMAVYISTIANGGTRLTPHLLKSVDDGSGWKDVPAPGAAFDGAVETGNDSGHSRRPLDGRERHRDGRPCPDCRPRRVREDRHRAGDLARGPRRGQGQEQQRPARQRLVRVFRAARQPADCRRRVRGARRPRRRHRGADCEARARDVLREAGRAAAAACADARRAATGIRRRSAASGVHHGQLTCSNDDSTTTSIGPCCSPS